MLGLMNLGAPPGASTQAPPPHMMPQSPVNTMPRSPYNDSRINSIQQPSQPPTSFNSGFSNGMPELNSFNTQDLRESLKALLPNASINFAPGIPSHQPTQLQHSRLRNNYMQPAPQQQTSSWGESLSQQTSNNSGSSALDDQFSDPAIVSGCLSSDTSNSPPSVQPHWLRSIQQLTEIDSPVKPAGSTQQQQQMPPPLPHTLPFRQPQTHSRMPFAQNIHLNQPGHITSGWPSLQPHNPPPGFQPGFRTATQNPHMATLES